MSRVDEAERFGSHMRRARSHVIFLAALFSAMGLVAYLESLDPAACRPAGAATAPTAQALGDAP